MERQKIFFTNKDLFCEAGLFLINRLDPVGATEIILTGVEYNQAKLTQDPDRIFKAYLRLHQELKLFKKNYLYRGKRHW